MEKILVSRCLLGHPVRYDGAAYEPAQLLRRWQGEGRVIALCPEVAGGLPIPRAPAEIAGAQGAMALDRLLPVLNIHGEDVSAAFLHGAQIALGQVAEHAIRYALLKSRSPSCGNLEGYDGLFSGNLVSGEGVTAAALRRAGVQVFNEQQIVQLAALLG